MSTTVSAATSTHEKLQRARAASAQLALLSTAEKNAILVAIAGAIEERESQILKANREEIEASGLEGAMRDRQGTGIAAGPALIRWKRHNGAAAEPGMASQRPT